MANLGTWKSPFPFRLGGKSHQATEDYYNMLRSGRSTVLSKEDGYADLEDRATARMFSAVHRANEQAKNEIIDPNRLTERQRDVTFPDTGETETISMLERWERILGIVPDPRAQLPERKQAVAGKLVTSVGNKKSAIETAMRNVFGDWFHSVVYNEIEDVDYSGKSPAGTVQAHWASAIFTFDAEYPGSYHADYPWYSGLFHFAVWHQPPSSADEDGIRRLEAKALEVLADMIPAWMSATISRIYPGATATGFYVGISGVGLTALLWQIQEQNQLDGQRANRLNQRRSIRLTPTKRKLGSTMVRPR